MVLVVPSFKSRKPSLTFWFRNHPLICSGVSPGRYREERVERVVYPQGHLLLWASRGAQTVKDLPASTGEVGSIPGSGRSAWRRAWQPTLVFLPGESHGQRRLVGCSPRVAKSQTRLSDFTFTFIGDLIYKISSAVLDAEQVLCRL